MLPLWTLGSFLTVLCTVLCDAARGDGYVPLDHIKKLEFEGASIKSCEPAPSTVVCLRASLPNVATGEAKWNCTYQPERSSGTVRCADRKNEFGQWLVRNGTCSFVCIHDRLDPTKIPSLTFQKGKNTTARREGVHPQIECALDEDANGVNVVNSTFPCPDSVQCRNGGLNPQVGGMVWVCDNITNADNNFLIMDSQVECEGYDDESDPFILEGSCRVWLLAIRKQTLSRLDTLIGIGEVFFCYGLVILLSVGSAALYNYYHRDEHKGDAELNDVSSERNGDATSQRSKTPRDEADRKQSPDTVKSMVSSSTASSVEVAPIASVEDIPTTVEIERPPTTPTSDEENELGPISVVVEEDPKTSFSEMSEHPKQLLNDKQASHTSPTRQPKDHGDTTDKAKD